MKTVCSYYAISGTVPFLDIDIENDNRIFIDPHKVRLSGQNTSFGKLAHQCMDTFMEEIVECILEGSPKSLWRGENLLQKFFEPRETHLGMSRRGIRGHGGADAVGTWIWEVLNGDVEALVRLGVLRQIEDIPLFVKGVDRDITSDIATRIIYSALADFTSLMVKKYPQFRSCGHGVEKFAQQVWSVNSLDWVEEDVLLPVADGEPLLLVPKDWVGSDLLMSARRFYKTTVLSYAQLEQIVVDARGKVIKTPKDQLERQPALRRGRDTNLTVTLRAFKNGEDLIRSFKLFVSEQLDKKSTNNRDAA
jgi:hypothetical protein